MRPFIAALALLATDVHAQVTETAFLDELPLVLTATRLAQAVEQTPAAVTLIDRDTIVASGARDVVELLRFVAGMQVTYADGSRPFVSYHGLVDEFSRRLQVLVDGRSVYNPFDGSVPWNELPLSLEDVARIEVVRGPDSPAYGANAFLATINIITESGASAPGWVVRGDAGIDNASRDAVVAYGEDRGDLDYRLSLAYQNDPGFAERNDTRRVRRARLRADYRLNPRDHLTLAAGYAGGPRGRGYFGDPLDPPRDAHTDSRFVQAIWRRTLAPGRELRLHYYRNDYRQKEPYTIGPLDLSDLGIPLVIDVPVDKALRVQRDEAELQYTLAAGAWRLAVGASVRRDRAASDLLLGGTADNRLRRAYVNAAWQVRPDLLANLGLMAEDNDLTGSDLSPRLVFNYRLSEAFTWRAGLTQALRIPTLWEAYGDYRIGSDIPGVGYVFNQLTHSDARLAPERLDGYELGFLYRPHRRLSIDYKIHYEEIRRLITAVEVPYPTDPWDGESEHFVNGDTAYVTGSEIQIDWRYARHGRLLLGYADTHIASADRYRLYSRSAPHSQASLLLSQRLPDPDGHHALAFSLAYHYYGPMTWLGEGDAVGAIRRLDLRIARELRFPRHDLDIELIVRSANGSYVEFRHDPGIVNRMTPATFLRLRWTWL